VASSSIAGLCTQTKREPKMVTRAVLAGYDVVEKRVPKYDWVERQDGWNTESVKIPHMVTRPGAGWHGVALGAGGSVPPRAKTAVRQPA
jgi:hypothetical protein